MSKREEPSVAERFAEYLREAARHAGYDIDSPRGGGRTALARDAGMSQSSVSRVLAGHTLPDPSFFEPLAAALGVELYELLVRSGLVTEGTRLPPGPLPKKLKPAEAVELVGIKDPGHAALAEAMLEGFLVKEASSRSNPTRGIA